MRYKREIHAEHAAGFDLNAACSGFLFALQTAQACIQAGIYRTVLVIGVDRYVTYGGTGVTEVPAFCSGTGPELWCFANRREVCLCRLRIRTAQKEMF